MLIPTRAQRLAQKKATPANAIAIAAPTALRPYTKNEYGVWSIQVSESTYRAAHPPRFISYCALCGTYSDAEYASEYHSKCGDKAINTFAPKEQFFDVRQPFLNPASAETIWLLKPGMREKVGAARAAQKSQSPAPS